MAGTLADRLIVRFPQNLTELDFIGILRDAQAGRTDKNRRYLTPLGAKLRDALGQMPGVRSAFGLNTRVLIITFVTTAGLAQRERVIELVRAAGGEPSARSDQRELVVAPSVRPVSS